MFRRNVLPPSSGSKSVPNKATALFKGQRHSMSPKMVCAPHVYNSALVAQVG
jgi:hypothetical protein